jgi:hypothetical protein
LLEFRVCSILNRTISTSSVSSITFFPVYTGLVCKSPTASHHSLSVDEAHLKRPTDRSNVPPPPPQAWWAEAPTIINIFNKMNHQIGDDISCTNYNLERCFANQMIIFWNEYRWLLRAHRLPLQDLNAGMFALPLRHVIKKMWAVGSCIDGSDHPRAIDTVHVEPTWIHEIFVWGPHIFVCGAHNSIVEFMVKLYVFSAKKP